MFKKNRYTAVALATLIATLFLFWNLNVQNTGLIEVEYSQTDDIFPNPDRGFYTWLQAKPGDAPLNPGALRSNRIQNRTLIIRLYYIKDFRDSDFTEEFLDQMRGDFQALRRAGMRAILKFRYSTAIGDPDAPLERVLGHLNQLEPVFEEFYDVISVAQAGFIGAWGEWHSSTNNLTEPSNMRQILFKFLDVLPERQVQVRNPNHKMRIFETNQPFSSDQAFDGSHISRTGYHNDCFLASLTDVGTYHLSNYPRIDLDGPLTIDWIKGNYLEPETRYVSMGGETCDPRPDAGDRYHCETALKEMAQMHWSFLNANYSRITLEKWEEQGCMAEVDRRLGYRFALHRGSFNETAVPYGTLKFNLEIENHGFAAPYNPRGVQVILRNLNDPEELWEVDLPEDPRYWMPGETITLDYELGLPDGISGSYEVLFNLPDPSETIKRRPEYSIRTANENTWERGTGFNHLDHVIIIEESADGDVYSGDLKFVYRNGEFNDVPSVAEESKNRDRASSFQLHQNFPNLFNLTTTISYELTVDSYIKLEVFDLIGRKVAVPIESYKSAGSYQVKVGMDGLSTGSYFYTLTTDHGTVSRAMTLMK